MSHYGNETITSTTVSTGLQQLLGILSKVAMALIGFVYTIRELWTFLAEANFLAMLT